MREEDKVTAEQPLIAVPFEVKLTVPVGVGGPAGETDALNVTGFPEVEGFGLEVTAVVVGVPLPDFTVCDKSPLLPL
jgi:hypothetical protein